MYIYILLTTQLDMSYVGLFYGGIVMSSETWWPLKLSPKVKKTKGSSGLKGQVW